MGPAWELVSSSLHSARFNCCCAASAKPHPVEQALFCSKSAPKTQRLGTQPIRSQPTEGKYSHGDWGSPYRYQLFSAKGQKLQVLLSWPCRDSESVRPAVSSAGSTTTAHVPLLHTELCAGQGAGIIPAHRRLPWLILKPAAAAVAAKQVPPSTGVNAQPQEVKNRYRHSCRVRLQVYCGVGSPYEYRREKKADQIPEQQRTCASHQVGHKPGG